MSSAHFKICGLTRHEDAAVAEAAGATFGGVILAPDSPRSLDVESARAVFQGTSLLRCGVFVNKPMDLLLEVADEVELNVLQLHGDEEPTYVARARKESGLEVWKAVRPRSADEFIGAVERYAESVDGLLLDGWSAAGRGGTGSRFPWEEVASQRDVLPSGVKLIVAGGLNPNNVAKIISVLGPDVVDVSSGVEAERGLKDERLVRSFAEAVAAVMSGTEGGQHEAGHLE